MSASRVGRKPVTIPSGVEIKMVERDLLIKGPKGQLVIPLHQSVGIELDGDNQLKVVAKNDGYCRSGTGAKLNKSIIGTIRSKINNVVQGVTSGFERKLTLVGVGYRAQVKGSSLHLSIGFSHPVVIDAPQGVIFEAPTLTEILVKGVDKYLVGHTAAIVRAVRPPEPYKGKGIRYANEKVVRKETKKK